MAIQLCVWLSGRLLPQGSMGVVLAVHALAEYWGGLWCLLGHMFPCMFRFKGGKGILSGGTIAIMIDWRIALVVWGGFLVLVLLTRYISLGSCWAGASFPFATYFVYHDVFLTVFGAFLGMLDSVHAPGKHQTSALWHGKQIYAAPIRISIRRDSVPSDREEGTA